MPADKNFKYKAFMSYSHKDRIWSEWLHKKLEGYRLPKALRQNRLDAGLDAGKLNPIFRDREELPAHENMTDKILEAIKASEFLVVVCSPHAVKSLMVNEEIREFRRLNGNKNILCLITSGEPNVFNVNSLDKDGELLKLSDDACFPSALFETSVQHIGLPDQPSDPLAADVRPEGDGKRNAYLKIAAGVLGVNLGELVRRDFVKRQRQITAALLLSVGISGAMGWLAWTAINESKRAEEQQIQAEQFANYFAEILYTEVPKTGRYDLMHGVVRRLREYYDNLEVSSLNNLYRKGWAYNRIGHILNTHDQRQDYTALQLEAINIANVLVEDDPDNIDYLYLKAKSHGSMAQTITWRGQPEQAIEHGLIEKRVLHQLLQKEPVNVEWLESLGTSYTISGLSYLRNLENVEAAEQDYRKALEIRSRVAKLPNKTIMANNLLGAAYGNISKVYGVKGPQQSMEKYAIFSVDTFQKNFNNDTANQNARFVLARSVEGLAHAKNFGGDIEATFEHYLISYNSLKSLLKLKLGSSLWEHTCNIVAVEFSNALISNGQYDIAQNILKDHDTSITAYYNGDDAKNYHISTFYFARRLEALMAFKRRNYIDAKDNLLLILNKYETDLTANLLTVSRIVNAYTSAFLLYGKILSTEGAHEEARSAWQKAIDVFGSNLQSKRMDIRANIAQIYMGLENYEKTQMIVDDLHARGYREVSYVRAIDEAIKAGIIVAPKGWVRAPDPVAIDVDLIS